MASEPDLGESSNHELSHPMVVGFNENSGETGNDPTTNAAIDPAHESGQFPDDFKSFLKYFVRREDERAARKEEEVRKEDERAKTLQKTLTESLESSIRQADKMQKAVVEAIKPSISQDTKAKFWNTYKTVSEEHDDNFREKYGGDLDTSLIFAGLFSAVSSAFIIQVQSSLQQNPNDVTQALLRVLIHNVNDSVFSGPDLVIPAWNGPPPSIIAVEGMLYISFFATLLVALLAVLGKQWLAYYAGVGMSGTIRQRGIERQKKFDGFRRWGFEYVMMTLPLLLQMALLLFGVAITIYLWSLQRAVAGIVLTLALLGVVAYLFFVLSDIYTDDSPFRTPIAAIIVGIWPWTKNGLRFITMFANSVRLSRRNHFQSRAVPPEDPESLPLQRPTSEIATIRTEVSLFEPQATENQDEYDCLAVLWMLETSTKPDVVAAAGSMATELQWSLNIPLILPLTRLRDTFMGCFEGSTNLRLRKSAMDHAIACGQGYHHLFAIHRSAQITSYEGNHDVDIPDDFFGGITDGSFLDSAELNFILSRLRGDFSEIEYSSFSPSFFKWALHISPYHLYFNSAGDQTQLDIPHLIRPSNLGVIDRSSFTNSLLYMGSYLGFRLNNRDLAVFNKSGHCEKVLEHLLQYLTECDQKTHFARMVFYVFETIVIFWLGMDHPPTMSYIRYKERIYKFCRRVPGGPNRKFATSIALELLSMFPDRQEQIFLPHAPEELPIEDEEWVREVSEFAHEELEKLEKGDDGVTKYPIVRLLPMLIPIPQFGRYKPSRQCLSVISKYLSPEGNDGESLQDVAYSVIWLARDYWFDDGDLWPMLQDLNIWSPLGPVVDTNQTLYGPSYMEMVGKLSGMRQWIRIVQYDVHRWINIYENVDESEGLGQNFCHALRNVVAADEGQAKTVEVGNTSALVLTAMESVWRNFDFSARIAIESFGPLAGATWLLIHAFGLSNFKRKLAITTAGEQFAARLGSATLFACNTMLERKPQPENEMGQKEIEAIEGIAKELTSIEEYLQGDSIVDDGDDSGSVKYLSLYEKYNEIRRRTKALHASLQELLKGPRSYLGVA